MYLRAGRLLCRLFLPEMCAELDTNQSSGLGLGLAQDGSIRLRSIRPRSLFECSLECPLVHGRSFGALGCVCAFKLAAVEFPGDCRGGLQAAEVKFVSQVQLVSIHLDGDGFALYLLLSQSERDVGGALAFCRRP